MKSNSRRKWELPKQRIDGRIRDQTSLNIPSLELSEIQPNSATTFSPNYIFETNVMGNLIPILLHRS